MGQAFTILGRGRLGRALHEAWSAKPEWKDRIQLCSHDHAPEGLVLLAVPDGAIPEMAARFSGRCVHTSGSLHLEGVPCAHPLTSFDGSPRDWQGTPLALTGEVPAIVRQALEALGFLPFALSPEHKALYHACAVLTSGHAATLWLGADALLKSAGVVLPGRGLMPLAEATVHNIGEKGAAGRTGPFVRGDQATIERDAQALPEGWREIFLKVGNLA